MDIEGKIRIPTMEELEKLKTIDISVVNSKATDFANYFSYNYETNKLSYLTSSTFGGSSYYVFSYYENCNDYAPVISNKGGYRVVFPYSKIKDIVKIIKNDNNRLEIECFSYPKNKVDFITKRKLNIDFFLGKLKETGKTYTIDTVNKQVFIEYKDEKNKYIKFYKNNWIKVEPIKFIVFEDLDLVISKDIIFSGIYFNHHQYYGDFLTTNIYKFLNEVFAKDIIPSETKEEEIIQNQTKVKEYSKNVNVDEEKEIYLKLKGNNEKLIEVLKLIKEKDIDINLLNEKQIVRSRSHYGYRK